MRALNLLKHGDDEFRLVSRVGSKWNSFGLRLVVPQDQLDGWKKECLGNTAECWNKVMQHWLDSGGIAEYCVS